MTVTAKKVPIPQPTHEIVLTMDEETARVLQSLVGSIGGNQINTYRKYTSGIWWALDGLGVTGICGGVLATPRGIELKRLPG